MTTCVELFVDTSSDKPSSLSLFQGCCHFVFLTNFVSRGISSANSPDEDGLANLLMASSSCGPLDKQQQPPLSNPALCKPH